MSGLRPGVGALGVTAAMVFAMGASTLGQSPSPSTPSNPAPIASAEVPAGPVAIGPITWDIVTKGEDFASDPAVYGVGQVPDGRLVVVGSVGADPVEATGAAWVSGDGSEWERLAGLEAPEGSVITAIANLGQTVVAVGGMGDGTGLAWNSGEGTVWTAPMPLSGVIYGLAATPAGFIGVWVSRAVPLPGGPRLTG